MGCKTSKADTTREAIGGAGTYTPYSSAIPSESPMYTYGVVPTTTTTAAAAAGISPAMSPSSLYRKQQPHTDAVSLFPVPTIIPQVPTGGTIIETTPVAVADNNNSRRESGSSIGGTCTTNSVSSVSHLYLHNHNKYDEIAPINPPPQQTPPPRNSYNGSEFQSQSQFHHHQRLWERGRHGSLDNFIHNHPVVVEK
eukprot:PhF_6_TR15024/c0_g1_i2/m.23564